MNIISKNKIYLYAKAFYPNIYGFKDIDGWRSYPMSIDSVAMLHNAELYVETASSAEM